MKLLALFASLLISFSAVASESYTRCAPNPAARQSGLSTGATYGFRLVNIKSEWWYIVCANNGEVRVFTVEEFRQIFLVPDLW